MVGLAIRCRGKWGPRRDRLNRDRIAKLVGKRQVRSGRRIGGYRTALTVRERKVGRWCRLGRIATLEHQPHRFFRRGGRPSLLRTAGGLRCASCIRGEARHRCGAQVRLRLRRVLVPGRIVPGLIGRQTGSLPQIISLRSSSQQQIGADPGNAVDKLEVDSRAPEKVAHYLDERALNHHRRHRIAGQKLDSGALHSFVLANGAQHCGERSCLGQFDPKTPSDRPYLQVRVMVRRSLPAAGKSRRQQREKETGTY